MSDYKPKVREYIVIDGEGKVHKSKSRAKMEKLFQELHRKNEKPKFVIR